MIYNKYLTRLFFFFLLGGINGGCSFFEQKPVRVPVFDASKLPRSPKYLEAVRLFEELPETQRESLAKSIVQSENWKKKFQPDNELFPEAYNDPRFLKKFLPKMRKNSSGMGIDKLLTAGNDLNEDPPLLIYLDWFEIVAEYYILKNPGDKNGWDFLWYFVQTDDCEHNYFTDIRDMIINKKMDQFKYGSEILHRTKCESTFFEREQKPL